MLEFLYKVDDTIESWIGIEDHLPRRQEISQRESARWGRRVVVFDQAKGVAKFFSKATKRDGTTEEFRRDDGMTRYAQDVFGALYFYRFVDHLDTLTFPIHDRWKNWNNQLTYIGKEKIRVPAGEFETLHFKMLPRVTGQLEPKGDVEIWVTNDSRRVLTQFRAKIKVGSITGELKEYKEGRPISLTPPVMKTPTHTKP
jgi:hypothetical protein